MDTHTRQSHARHLRNKPLDLTAIDRGIFLRAWISDLELLELIKFDIQNFSRNLFLYFLKINLTSWKFTKTSFQNKIKFEII